MCMSCDWMAFDFGGYNAILSWRYLKCWFNNSYCCLLFAVAGVMWEICHPSVCSNSSLVPSIWQWEFLLCISAKIMSVSGNLSQMIKLCVNLKSAILRWSAVIPNAIIGDLSAVFNVVGVSWIGVLKLSSMSWYVEHAMSDIAAPGSVRTL